MEKNKTTMTVEPIEAKVVSEVTLGVDDDIEVIDTEVIDVEDEDWGDNHPNFISQTLRLSRLKN